MVQQKKGTLIDKSIMFKAMQMQNALNKVADLVDVVANAVEEHNEQCDYMCEHCSQTVQGCICWAYDIDYDNQPD